MYIWMYNERTNELKSAKDAMSGFYSMRRVPGALGGAVALGKGSRRRGGVVCGVGLRGGT